MYEAPVANITHALLHIAGVEDAYGSWQGEGLSEEVMRAVLEEAGRFASERITPLRHVGDEHAVALRDGEVITPPGWKETYRDWIAGGWNALAGPVEHGGQGLPQSLSVAAQEMWNAGSMAFALGPLLTMGAVEALHRHGSDELKDMFLGRLVSGEWMGTMNLTEPHAGSDLSELKTRAEKQEDGTYRIFGQKIFITYGDHDLTDNIVHMVLARIPGAPAGTRGLSLFLVPKILPDGSRNDLFCHSLEKKLGIHGSPTCTMIYGDGRHGDSPGAKGWLVGEENKGLACMFTMMNNARLAVGMQGIAIAEAALQLAERHADERRQGKASGWTRDGMAPIRLHPDVRRSLHTMRAMVHASRAIAYSCAHALDMAVLDQERRDFWQARADLLTPLAKAYSTDMGCEAASIGLQVHGGMGFIEETGAAQLLRDVRITPIYEGTNGIQAIDLVMRKLPLQDGAHMDGFIAELEAIVRSVQDSNRAGFGMTAARLDAALQDLRSTTAWLRDRLGTGHRDAALAGATPYLRLASLATAGALLAKGALACENAEHVSVCRFFAENLLCETAGLRMQVEQGADSVLAE